MPHNITHEWSKLTEANLSVDPGFSTELRSALAAVTGKKPRDRPEPGGIHVGVTPPTEIPISKLSWFHTTNAGVDNILAREAWPADVLFTRTVGNMSRRIAEYVLAWMLADSQKVAEQVAQHNQRVWRRVPLRLIEGDQVIVFGSGHVGGKIAGLLSAVGAHVVGVATTASNRPGFDRIVDRDGALELLPSAAWLVAALPLTSGTINYFDADFFGRCSGACFINVGRGATVVTEALQNALKINNISGAILDVLAHEPPGDDDVHWTLPRTVITPHTAGVTAESDIIADFTVCWNSLRSGRIPDLAVDLTRGY